MKPKNKKIMTVGLAVSAIGIWIPQVFVGVVEPRSSERMDVTNGDGVFEAAIEEDQNVVAMGEEFMAQPASGSDALEWETAVAEKTSFKAAMNSVASRLERQSERPKRVNLDELMSAFRTKESESEAKPTVSMSVPQSGEVEVDHSVRLPESNMLEEFCSQAILSAVIQGDGQVLGMLNGMLVRVGDMLGHGIQVVGFKKRSVLLRRGKHASSVGLPSFRVAGNSTSLDPANAGANELDAPAAEQNSADAVSGSVQGGQDE